MKNSEKIKTPIQNIYSVMDTVAGRFSPPFIAVNDRTAERDFRTALMDQNSLMSKNPHDFHLFRLGSWDQDDGQLDAHAPELICTGNIVDKK